MLIGRKLQFYQNEVINSNLKMVDSLRYGSWAYQKKANDGVIWMCYLTNTTVDIIFKILQTSLAN